MHIDKTPFMPSTVARISEDDYERLVKQVGASSMSIEEVQAAAGALGASGDTEPLVRGVNVTPRTYGAVLRRAERKRRRKEASASRAKNRRRSA